VKRAALVILGMHRSGTSAAARLCSLLGVDLGTDLLPPDRANPEGYWEHRGVLDADEALLTALDRPWHDVRPLPAGWRESKAASTYRDALIGRLSKDFANAPVWGVKDPRLCRLIPAWPDVFAALDTVPCYLIVLRHPGAVARSLAARDSLAPANGYLLWLRYLLEAEAATRGLRRAFLLYDRMLNDWEAEAERLGRSLGIDWPESIPDIRQTALSFLKPDLRHHTGDTVEDLPAWVAELWTAVLDSDTDEDPLTAAADRIGRAIADADALYLPLVDRQRSIGDELQTALQAATDSLKNAAAGIDQRNRLIAELKRRTAESDAVIMRLERRIKADAKRTN